MPPCTSCSATSRRTAGSPSTPVSALQKTQEALREAGYGPAVNSLHLRAKAVDFTLPGVSMRNVARATWALKLGGVGYYEDMNFVHMDSRGAQARWADSFL